MYNILVCDDEKEIVDAVEIYLMQEGYRVFKAYDGQQALELMRQEKIHLLILDLMMPGMDGIHATLKIREESSIPIIILSAKSQDSDVGTGGQSEISASAVYNAWDDAGSKRGRAYLSHRRFSGE